jgi:predicted transcriptional regulator
MHEVRIRDEIWEDLKAAAERRQRKPDALANQALKDFLRRIADEELLARSIASARRSPVRASNAERAVRELRRKK